MLIVSFAEVDVPMVDLARHARPAATVHPRRVWPLVALLALGPGCGPRHVDPVPISRAGDDALSCAQIDQEIAARKTAATAYASLDKQVENANIAAGIAAGLVGFPALLAMDLTREEQIKLRSTLDRINRIEFLKDQKQCPPSP